MGKTYFYKSKVLRLILSCVLVISLCPFVSQEKADAEEENGAEESMQAPYESTSQEAIDNATSEETPRR